MNYEQALELAKGHRPTPPEFQTLSLPAGAKKWRSIGLRVAIVVALYGYLVMADEAFEAPTALLGGDTLVALALPAGLLLWCLWLAGSSVFRGQLALRALLWSNLIIGVVLALFIEAPVAGLSGALVGVGCGGALLLAGRRGLETLANDPTFRPSAFSARLVFALILAVADAQTLLFSAVIKSGCGRLFSPDSTWSLGDAWHASWLVWLCAATMLLAVWGVLRLRVWAIVLNVVANFVIAYWALGGDLGVSSPVAGALAWTAAVQLFVPVPLLAAMLGDRGVVRESAPWVAWLPRIAVAVLTLSTLLGLSQVRIASHMWVERGTGRMTRRASPQLTRTPTVQLAAPAPGSIQAGASFYRHQHVGGWRGADLRGIDFQAANLSELDLGEADLRGANLRGAALPKPGPELEGIRWDDATCPDGTAAVEHGQTCSDHLRTVPPSWQGGLHIASDNNAVPFAELDVSAWGTSMRVESEQCTSRIFMPWRTVCTRMRAFVPVVAVDDKTLRTPDGRGLVTIDQQHNTAWARGVFALGHGGGVLELDLELDRSVLSDRIYY